MDALTAALIGYHGLLTVGLTSYPAAEGRFTLTHDNVPGTAITLKVKAPISKPEPVSLEASVHLVLWRF